MYCFFFFKQKTAYEMRISDWSSDVCSSDLPSFRAQKQLYQWVEKANLRITPDGFILAFKRVKKDYWDHRTGETFFHKVGAVLEMPRSECDEDTDRHCSSGIHFCSIAYLNKSQIGRTSCRARVCPSV